MWDNGKEHRFLHKKSFKPKLVMGKDVRGLVVTKDLGRQEDYPVVAAFIDSHFYIYNVNPPNDLVLMKLYADVFGKVMANLGSIIA